MRTLASLAMLKVNANHGANYIDNFVPYIVEALRCMPRREVALPEVQAAVNELFGLILPLGALRTILGRAEREGFLVIEHGVYKRNDARYDDNFPRLRDEVLRGYEALIRKLVLFCKNEFATDWSPDEADQALMAYLKDYTADVFSQIQNGGQSPAFVGDEAQKATYLVARFIAEILHSDPTGFELLETVVKGCMLANVLMFPDIKATQRPLDRLEVYLDTPVILRAIGAAGPSLQAPCTELLELLRAAKAKLRIFEHTQTEVVGVLDAAAHSLRAGDSRYQGLRDVSQYFLTANLRVSDVELMIANLPRTLSDHYIGLKEKPGYSIEHSIDEIKLGAMLDARIKYKREEARQNDIDSLAAIHRLRNGRSTPNLDVCGAIFVTTNASVTRISSQFYKSEYPGTVVPHCILEHALATVIWLRNPVQAPDLPRKQLIAECYAALNPPDPLWKAYIEEIERLRANSSVREEDYYLLRFSNEARRALMDLTLGRPEVFTEGTIQEVLERAKAAAREQTEVELAAEREQRKEAEDRSAELERIRRQQEERLDRIGLGFGKGVIKSVLSVCTALVALAFYLTLPKPIPSLPESITTALSPLLLLVLVCLGVLSVLSLSVGATVYSILRPVEQIIARSVRILLYRLAGFPIPRSSSAVKMPSVPGSSEH